MQCTAATSAVNCAPAQTRRAAHLSGAPQRAAALAAPAARRQVGVVAAVPCRQPRVCCPSFAPKRQKQLCIPLEGALLRRATQPCTAKPFPLQARRALAVRVVAVAAPEKTTMAPQYVKEPGQVGAALQSAVRAAPQPLQPAPPRPAWPHAAPPRPSTRVRPLPPGGWRCSTSHRHYINCSQSQQGAREALEERRARFVR